MSHNRLTPRQLVERFYHVVWNEHDAAAAHALLDPAFRFRGSLGAELVGPEDFCGYMDSVHRSLGNYRCEIVEIVEDGSKVAARMLFSGIHRDVFVGAPPTGRRVSWSGAAFFATGPGRIIELWVLGDLDGLRAQLSP